MPLIFSSLIARMLMLLLLVFILSLAVVYWIIDQQSKPEVTKLASQSVIESGNVAVNGITARLSQIDGLAMSASRMVGGLPKDTGLIENSFGNIITHTDQNIIGGGVWYDPNVFKANLDEQAFAWRRDRNGVMKPDLRYMDMPSNTSAPITNSPAKLASPYYRDWWYVPAMYANHDHCVWSRAYVQASSGLPMVTCAKALFNAQTNGFEGVVSFDILLSQLQTLAKNWQQKTGGYVFLVDMNNNFLTFPDESMVKQITANNPQGEMMDVDTFAAKYPSFAPICQSLENINQKLINQAKQQDASKFDFVTGTIVSTTNLQRTTPKEAQILTALMMTNRENADSAQRDNHFVEQVNLSDDVMLKQPSTAFVFAMPMINWKLVIVKPNHELVAFANQLGKQLQWYLLLGFIPVLLISAYVFRRVVGSPLRRIARSVSTLGDLVEQKRYLALTEHKLPPTQVSEIAVITDSMNQLIDRVVENEGALAQVNERLEQQVVERTEHLNQALKDLKASQVQLVQAEKMSTLGQMVAGVAHEVNTPLGYVSSNLELIDASLGRYEELVQRTQQLKSVVADPNADDSQLEQAIGDTIACGDELVADALHDDLTGLVEDAQFGVTQISELVVNLRDFSRLDEAKIKDTDINACITSSLTIARNNLKTLEVVTDLHAVSEISCNPSQINQVLLNLFNNAAQAMDGNGTLTVESLEDDANVYVRVSDTGSGMSNEVIQQIFEPFFTTKAAGEGTGLGLAISAQIMEQHHGKIDVDSTVGKGTTFTLTLPKTQVTAANASTKRLLLD